MLGYEVGLSLGLVDGEGVAVVGALVEDSVGATLGAVEGRWLGENVGLLVLIGESVGSVVGGLVVGARVTAVGERVS